MVRLVGALLLFLHVLLPAPDTRSMPRPGPEATPSSAVAEAAATISEDGFLEKVGIMAHDSMLGRDTPSRGLNMTAEWIAREFSRLGLEPGGDGGSFLQGYSVQRVVPDIGRSSALSSTGARLEFGVDLGFFSGPTGEGEIDAPVVLLTGVPSTPNAPPMDRIRGSHVVLLPSAESTRPSGRGIISRVMEHGPASLILVVRQSDREWRRSADLAKARIRIRLPWRAGSNPPIFTLRAESLGRLLDGSAPPCSPEGIRLKIIPSFRVVEEFEAPNVVGILEGRDRTLKGEYIVYSGHMDHLGVGVPDRSGDSIYNGADDSASGTASMMEVAEAFASLEPRPRRSVVFLAVSGEEKGLWGSFYFTSFPPVPGRAIVANLNAGMVGRNSPDTIVAIGGRYSGLGGTLERVGRAHRELGLTTVDDPWPEQRFFERSDHLPFARMGVPALFFFSGTHADYHHPSDEVEKLDAGKSARVAKLLFYLGLELADAPLRPRWNPERYAEIVTVTRG